MTFYLENEWKKYTQINNDQIEIVDFGKGKLLVIHDFLKYPDKLLECVEKLPFFTSSSSSLIRPGKSFPFHHDYLVDYGSNLLNFICSIIGCSGAYISDIIVNRLNGNMKTHYEYPHTDVDGLSLREENSNVVGNIGLTKDIKGGTGFWSFNGKMGLSDMTIEEYNQFSNFFNSVVYGKERPINWRQIEDEGPWKLEFICPLEYNSYVLYSPSDFHSPFIKPNWYLDFDRVSIATFFRVNPNDLNFLDSDRDYHKEIWKVLKLDTIFNHNI